MQVSLAWIAGVAGAVIWVCGILLQRGAPARPVARPYLVAAVLLPLVVYLASLPSKPPFSGGHGLGTGFALGGVGALLAYLAVARVRAGVPSTAILAAGAAATGTALTIVAVPLLFLRHLVIDGLAGIALGWLAVGFIALQLLDDEGATSHARGAAAMVFSLAGGFAVALCATAVVAIYREAVTPELPAGMWGAATLVFAATTPAALLLAALLQPLAERLGVRSRVLDSAVMLLPLIAAELLALKALNLTHFFYIAALGPVCGGIAGWLLREAARPLANSPVGGLKLPPTAALPVAAFIVLAGASIAGAYMQGYGMALMALGAWLPVGLGIAPQESENTPENNDLHFGTAQTLLHVAVFTTVLALYRVLWVRFRADLGDTSLDDHQVLLAFIAGALLPGLAAGAVRPYSLTPRPVARLLRLMLAGIVTLAVPLVILVLWGVKCAPLLVLGGALSSVACLAGGMSWPRLMLQSSWFALAASMALVQWTHHVAAMKPLSRDTKIHLVLYGAALAVVCYLVSEYGERYVVLRIRRAQQEGLEREQS